MSKPASEKQTALIARLLTEKATPAGFVANPTTSAAASAIIDFLFTCPRIAKPAAEDAAGPGYYVRDLQVFVVVENKAKTNVYAKSLEIVPADPATGRQASASWVYAPGVARTFTAAERLSAQEAAALGHAHGFCFRCCKALNDKRSVAAGYGETCAKRLGFPYPTLAEAEAILVERYDLQQHVRFA